MTWTVQHDLFVHELRRRLALAPPVHARLNSCYEVADTAAALAREMGLPHKHEIGWWRSHKGTTIPHAWVRLGDDLILHSRRRIAAGLEVEITRGSAAFEAGA